MTIQIAGKEGDRLDRFLVRGPDQDRDAAILGGRRVPLLRETILHGEMGAMLGR